MLVLPAVGKPMDVFQAEEGACRAYAQHQLGGAPEQAAAVRRLQERYDIASIQCLYAKGNIVPGVMVVPGPSVAPLPPGTPPPPSPPQAPGRTAFPPGAPTVRRLVGPPGAAGCALRLARHTVEGARRCGDRLAAARALRPGAPAACGLRGGGGRYRRGRGWQGCQALPLRPVPFA